MPSKYAQFNSRPHDAVIRVYDDAGNVIASFQVRAPDGCRFPDRRTAIPLSFEAFEPALQTLPNVAGHIRTKSKCHKSDALPFGGLWYDASNVVGNAFCIRGQRRT